MLKTPVYLINGFLGSGKTTVLLECMNYFKKNNTKVAIILNELGNVNVEKHLFKEESLFELLNGCICCSIKDDLKTTLSELKETVEKEKIDIVLLEGTGVANPGEIIETFAEQPFADYFSIVQSVCVIDSVNVLDYTSIFSSSKEVRELQKEQIEKGSLLVLNKLDQLSKKDSLQKVEKVVRKYNASAPIIYSSYGKGVVERIESLIPATRIEALGHAHHVHVKAVKIEQKTAVSKKEIIDLLHKHQNKVIRAKGSVQNKEDLQWYHFQYAAGQLVWEKLADKPREEKGQIILIGEKLSREEIFS
ncbi:CobW family GTP-binding protein [Niallia nealsonii]|uniref:CobW family GTP-binding protein n=1 Tax=Niallia nealsonii TaxID=115979 RepID=UPI001446E560|nr:GTP-binding protein [Niallia nealsonii]